MSRSDQRNCFEKTGNACYRSRCMRTGAASSMLGIVQGNTAAPTATGQRAVQRYRCESGFRAVEVVQRSAIEPTVGVKVSRSERWSAGSRRARERIWDDKDGACDGAKVQRKCSQWPKSGVRGVGRVGGWVEADMARFSRVAIVCRQRGCGVSRRTASVELRAIVCWRNSRMRRCIRRDVARNATREQGLGRSSPTVILQ